MRIVRAAVISVFLAGAAACGPPPPPALSHAESTAGLRVRINDKTDYLGTGDDEERDATNAEAIALAQRALVARLKEAGYVVVEKGAYDLSAGTSFTIRRVRRQDPEFARARMRLKDRKGNVVEEITIQFTESHAPISEPDRVAVTIVNEMNKSLKLAAVAKDRAKAPTSDSPAPAPAAPAPAPATP